MFVKNVKSNITTFISNYCDFVHLKIVQARRCCSIVIIYIYIMYLRIYDIIRGFVYR